MDQPLLRASEPEKLREIDYPGFGPTPSTAPDPVPAGPDASTASWPGSAAPAAGPKSPASAGGLGHATASAIQRDQGDRQGLLKILSKMGIPTIRSYTGAQIFETIGLDADLADRHFHGTTSRRGRIGIDVLAREALLPPGGLYGWRRFGETHMWSPDTIASLQRVVRGGNGDARTAYAEFARLVNDDVGRRATLRGLMRLTESAIPVPLDEVEPAAEIVKRFSTGAMSLGSLSPEAHETLAIAMNRIGGKPNTGEGGRTRGGTLPTRVRGYAAACAQARRTAAILRGWAGQGAVAEIRRRSGRPASLPSPAPRRRCPRPRARRDRAHRTRARRLPRLARLAEDERGNVRADGYATWAPGVFACGDARRGQSPVVWAINEGRECARAVNHHLTSLAASRLVSEKTRVSTCPD
ncbi:MAG: glutamate synthase-related protein [Egibacteraceae bacterium]